MTELLTDVRQISRLAYGFMASRSLFAALDLDLFGRIADGARDIAALAAATGVPSHRLETLVAALVSVGALERKAGGLANAPAVQTYLVPGAPAYFGEYYRLQIGRQIYRDLVHLEAGLRGDLAGLAHPEMKGWLSDPAEARDFSDAQHAGSTGPALMLAKGLDLDDADRLLDVAGGTGAYSIAFCRKNPRLLATILDFPTVLDVARDYVARSGVSERISLLPGDARDTPWPDRQDVVFMSYLLSAVAGGDIPDLLTHAFTVLRPDGRLVVHDFMLDGTRSGPLSAALFFTSYLVNQPDAVSFTAGEISAMMEQAGFVEPTVEEMIPDITMIVAARKPADV